MLIEFHLHQQGDQLSGFMHEYAMFFGAGDDGFGYQPVTLGDNFGC